MSDAVQQELAFLGVASSPAFVRAPEGNGCAERFIRTLKENLLWVRRFETIEELPEVSATMVKLAMIRLMLHWTDPRRLDGNGRRD